jgi:hypothetical protein
MFKKPIVYIILLSMTLHCGCRLGFLDLLYQKRHQIAFTIGLIGEVPMTMCNSDYDFDRGIKIESTDSEGRMPISTIAHEIDLFYIPGYQLLVKNIELYKEYHDSYSDTFYQDHPYAVFHPPALS